METVRRVTPDERIDSDPTAGISREEAFATDRVWAGLARTSPGTTSGWHHHGDNETTIYVLSGTFRVESGAGGERVDEGRPGDFMLIPPGLIHRESNPAREESRLIVVRAGTGPPTINVEGPEA